MARSEDSTRILEEPSDSLKRNLTGAAAAIVAGVAVLSSLYHVYSLGIRATSVLELRALHLMVAFIIVPLLYAPFSGRKAVSPLDWLMAIAGVVTTFYVLTQNEDFVLRAGVSPTAGDLVLGAVAIVLILEMVRRLVGLPLTILTLVLVLYAKFASFFPGPLRAKSYPLARIISQAFSIDGIYGIPIGASSTFVLLFILFGAVLNATGTGKFYTDLAYAGAGRLRGGPAKVAVFASALFGTISGSGIANVVATGTFTIPLMKSTGFLPHFAGAVEAVASTGGQIMPPVMGAGAFLMAEMVSMPYSKIAISAALPAILYFLAVYLMIDLEAGRMGLKGLPSCELPDPKAIWRTRGHLIIPLLVLLYELVIVQTTAIRAALFAIYTAVAVSFLRKDTRLSWKGLLGALADGTKGCMEVIASCACAGIVVAMISLTGVGLKLSTAIVSLSHGSLFLALVLTAVIVVILSMGLPTTACYLISAAVMGPALTKMGISPLQAHMFIFYFACVSGITPPVALVAYPAAAIARTSPIQVALTAAKLGIVGFLVPFMFVYTPGLLLMGSPGWVAWSCLTSTLGVFALSVALEGWLSRPVAPAVRAVLLAGGVLLMIAEIKTDLIGLGCLAAGLTLHYLTAGVRRSGSGIRSAD
ncbi:MAG: TRAP transporter permease [Firmicutes bacterium]|nr:TRAP transporter permease [Bacillota bacterium]